MFTFESQIENSMHTGVLKVVFMKTIENHCIYPRNIYQNCKYNDGENYTVPKMVRNENSKT